MRAHRTNIKRRESAKRGASLPRPIHVYLLRYIDKEYVLRNAASKLRDNPFQEANLYISDDVSKFVREERKKTERKASRRISRTRRCPFCIHSLERTSSDNL